MPSPPRTVLDGLEGVWDDATERWREANRRREAAELADAQAKQRAARAVSTGVERAVNNARAGAAQIEQRVRGSRGAAIVSAMFGERTNPEPENGPINYQEVDGRVRQTRDGLQRIRAVTRASGEPLAPIAGWSAATAQWLNRVKPHGIWDDKEQKPPPRKLHERQGNFSYGATAAALGLPQEVALRGAGFVQRVQAVGDALKGGRGEKIRERQGWLYPPYGDDARDQRPIVEGYDYGRRLTQR